MSEQKPVAYCRQDTVMDWQGQLINAAMMHPSPKGLLNPIALFTAEQLKAEREKAIRDIRIAIGVIPESARVCLKAAGYDGLVDWIDRLKHIYANGLSTNESKENEVKG